MSSWPSPQENCRTHINQAPPPPIYDIDGNDIGEMVRSIASTTNVPVVGLLGLLIAESALNPRAERYGRRTRDAQIAIEKEDWSALQEVINDTWPDISFGMSQRIVLYHWWGDHSGFVENVLSVRKAVFNGTKRDILEAAVMFRNCLDRAGDDTLNALVIYNAGYLPLPDDPWWTRWAGNVANFQAALNKAQYMLTNGGGI